MDLRAKITDAVYEHMATSAEAPGTTARRITDAVMGVVEGRARGLEAELGSAVGTAEALRGRVLELRTREDARDKRIKELEDENQRLRDTATVTRYVADHWREAAVTNGWTVASHPLCLVLAALNGETEPERLGLDEEDRAALDWARDIAKEET